MKKNRWIACRICFTAHLETVLVYGWFGFVFVWGRVVGNEQSGSNKWFLEKDVFSPCHKRGSEEKFWVPMTNQTSDLWIPCFNALPLSHRDSMVSSRSITKFIWHTSYIMLGSTKSIVIFSCYVSLPHDDRKTKTMTDWDKSLKHWGNSLNLHLCSKGGSSSVLDEDLIQYYQFLADKGDVQAQVCFMWTLLPGSRFFIKNFSRKSMYSVMLKGKNS